MVGPSSEATSISSAVYISAPGDTIRLAPGTYSGVGRNVGLVIRHELVIVGAGTESTILDAQFESRHFEVRSLQHYTRVPPLSRSCTR